MAKWSQNDQDGQPTLTCFKPAQSVGLYEFLSRSAEKTYVQFPERVKIVYCCIYDKITEVRRNVEDLKYLTSREYSMAPCTVWPGILLGKWWCTVKMGLPRVTRNTQWMLTSSEVYIAQRREGTGSSLWPTHFCRRRILISELWLIQSKKWKAILSDSVKMPQGMGGVGVLDRWKNTAWSLREGVWWSLSDMHWMESQPECSFSVGRALLLSSRFWLLRMALHPSGKPPVAHRSAANQDAVRAVPMNASSLACLRTLSLWSHRASMTNRPNENFLEISTDGPN